MYHSCPFAVVNPPLGGKVGGLRTVKAVVETSVVAEWKGDDELSGLLDHLEGNTMKRDLSNVHSQRK